MSNEPETVKHLYHGCNTMTQLRQRIIQKIKEWTNNKTLNDIKDIIKNVCRTNTMKQGKNNITWFIDQLTLYSKILEWDKQKSNFIRLNEKLTKFNRLDRNTFDIRNVNVRENITQGKYTDYHCYIPMSKYYDINWEVYNLIPGPITN